MVNRALYVLPRTLRVFRLERAANREESRHPLTGFCSPSGCNQYSPAVLLTARQLFGGFCPFSVSVPWESTYPRVYLTRVTVRLGVSHPLGVFLLPRPGGLISSRLRSWGSPFRAFSYLVAGHLSVPFLLCRSERSRSLVPRVSRNASETSDKLTRAREGRRLRSITPPGSTFP